MGVFPRFVGVLAVVGAAAGAGAYDGTFTMHHTNIWSQGGGGGPFKGSVSITSGAYAPFSRSNYLTFCIEKNEFVNGAPPDATYSTNVNTAAVNGGSGGGSPDPLDSRTAYLYTLFCGGEAAIDAALAAFDADSGALAGDFDFAWGVGADGAAMQRAIWLLEDEESWSLSSDLKSTLWRLADWAVNGGYGGSSGGFWSGLGNVRVLNLYKKDSSPAEYRQDMLVCIPLPGAGGLASAGLGGLCLLGGLRRRR